MTLKEFREKTADLPEDTEIFTEANASVEENYFESVLFEPYIRMAYVKNYEIAIRPCKETAGAKKAVIIC